MPQKLTRFTALLVMAIVGLAVFSANHSAVAQEGGEANHQLYFQWTLTVWDGPDGIDAVEALSGTGAAEGGTDVSDIVTAIHSWNGATQAWESFFIAGVGVPGANDFDTLTHGAPYWIAINTPDGAMWTVPSEGLELIRIGALLSLSGPGSTLGITSQAALNIAVGEWNTMLRDADADYRFALRVENTQQDPEEAVEAFNALADWGARAIIGPQSSSELQAIGPLAAAAGVIVISHGSTASAIAGEFENVFRFVPTDIAQAQAIVELMIEDGIEAIVPIWREDLGNTGHADSVRAFAELNGLTVADGVSYGPTVTDFSDALEELAAQVSEAVDDSDADSVAVYLPGFEEVGDILAAAGEYAGLDGVRWYGADGSANTTPLITTEGSAEFAVSVGGFVSALLALPADAAIDHADLIEAVTTLSGNTPDAFVLAAYDAFNAVAEALLEDDPIAAFLALTNPYEGVTGTINLNADGDRELGAFAFYSICEDGDGGHDWVQTGLWEPGAMPGDPGTLTMGTCEDAIG